MRIKNFSRQWLSAALIVGLPVLSNGCFIVDAAKLDSVTVGMDSGVGGTLATSETCGGAGAVTVMAGIYSVMNNNAIDTRTATNDVDPLCQSAPGPEVFVQFDASAGQYWHFHVHPNNPAPGDGGTAIMADPVLLLYPVVGGTCNTTNCNYVSNRCPAGQDEHFGLEIPSTGVWALGIDNATTTGSRYDVTIFRPTCGNNPNPNVSRNGDGMPPYVSAPEHGEGCDDGNVSPGDGCDEKCRVEFDTSNLSEAEPNDDRFWGNHALATVANTTSTPFEVQGSHSICDVDTFMVRLGVGEQLVVHITSAAGVRYTPANIPLGLAVHTATGQPIGYTADGNGDAVVTTPVASAGTDYFVYVGPATNGMPEPGMNMVFPYRVQLDVN